MTHHGNPDEHDEGTANEASESGGTEAAGRAQAADVVDDLKEKEELAEEGGESAA